MEKPFTIFQISWLTQQPGNEGARDQIVEHFYHVLMFLQSNGLVRRRLMNDRQDLTDDFALSSDDLTADGLAVMRAGYDKWLQKVDDGMDPSDVSILQGALTRIRST